MRLESLAKDIRPNDMVWFSGDRKPSVVLDVAIQDGAEKLVVLTSNSSLWYLPYNTGKVFKFEPDPVVEPEPDVVMVYEDPDGNPT